LQQQLLVGLVRYFTLDPKGPDKPDVSYFRTGLDGAAGSLRNPSVRNEWIIGFIIVLS
jgi:hypothetical protein